MTLDEAIKHCLEVAEQNDAQAEKWREEGGEEWGKTTACRECAADHRQLAEWLTELKELRNSLGAVKLSNMKEACELIRDYKAENITQKKLIAEYKRLLKAAVDGYRFIGYITKDYACPSATSCSACPMDEGKQCRIWEHADEALALIGEDGEQNG